MYDIAFLDVNENGKRSAKMRSFYLHCVSFLSSEIVQVFEMIPYRI